MNYRIHNNSNMKYAFGDELQSLLGFAQERFGFKNPPSIHFNSDADNASKHLGKTAYYDPESAEIHIYVDGRHAKDIMRSIAHELVHHVQNEQGSLATNGYAGEGYAQKNPQLRKMEREAYEKGNMCFRDWEDSYKSTNYSQRSDDMSLNEWKNKELGGLLTSRWGFSMDLGKLKEMHDPMMDMPMEPESKCEPEPDPCGCPDLEDDPMDPLGSAPVAYLAEEDKKPDEDGDGVPDWADEKPGEDDNEDKKSKLEEKIFRTIMKAIKKGN